jgi:hypothetical protein
MTSPTRLWDRRSAGLAAQRRTAAVSVPEFTARGPPLVSEVTNARFRGLEWASLDVKKCASNVLSVKHGLPTLYFFLALRLPAETYFCQ